ncbi:hypothetical protein [Paraburkholderia sartisoli]|uniref:Uncharacterized protein n=1 Tax=Paraburkholderia sartisoli TaxID=83784 RepID=A0A1H4HT02_9BURK|nr:hypothetical protein [Paraburkholderia sartisoli]SEB24801.1 hypothetical protein SAMN05192564_11543 [Paraburkholderia sartisoli]
MCLPNLVSAASAASATTGSGAPYAFGGSAPADTSSIFTPANTNLALGTAGGAFSLIGAISKANNTVTADNAQANQLQTNAVNAEQAAASAVTSGIGTAANTETKGAQTVASQRAAMAANGIDVNASGTAQNVQKSTQYITDQNVDTITANAARTAMGYTQQSQSDSANAAAYRAAAASVSPTMAGATSLLTSATGVASNWYRNQRAGVS